MLVTTIFLLQGSTKDSGAEDSETEDGVADETVYSMMSLINLTQHIVRVSSTLPWLTDRVVPCVFEV